MATGNYRKAFDDAKAELAALVAQRNSIDNRIGQLRQTVRALAEVCGEKPDQIEQWMTRNATERPAGFSGAIRAVLKASEKPFTPKQMRDELLRSGVDIGRYQNSLAVIHTVLKRLVTSGEVAKTNDGFQARAVRDWASRARKR